MQKFFLYILIGVLALAIGVSVVLLSPEAVVVHPKGIIANQILDLIITNILLMLSIIIPTYILLFIVISKYVIRRDKVKYDPNHTVGPIGQLLMWGLPSLVIVVMSVITWEDTHKLNPYLPIESDKKPLTVQVVALNWKWLFIYPEQGIAVLNYLQIPEQTPIHLNLTADHSPMNSFWIPQLSGQIYAMTGMRTQLNLQADKIGDFVGRNVEINGDGYADMVFPVKSTSQKDFDDWIAEVKKSPNKLTPDVYSELVKPAINKSVIFYSQVEDEHFRNIIHQYMFPAKPVL